MVKNISVFFFLLFITQTFYAQEVVGIHEISKGEGLNEFNIKTKVSGLEGADLARITYFIPKKHNYKASSNNGFFSKVEDDFIKFYIMSIPTNGEVVIELGVVLSEGGSFDFPVEFQYSKKEEKIVVDISSLKIENGAAIAMEEPSLNDKIDEQEKIAQQAEEKAAERKAKEDAELAAKIEKVRAIAQQEEEERIAKEKAEAEAKKQADEEAVLLAQQEEEKAAERKAKEDAELAAKIEKVRAIAQQEEEERIAKEKAEAEAKKQADEEVALLAQQEEEKAAERKAKEDAELAAKIEKVRAIAQQEEEERIAKEKAEKEAALLAKQEAERLAKESSEKSQPASNGVKYGVQIFALSKYTEQKVRDFCKRNNLDYSKINTKEINGITKVRYGSVNTKSAAAALKEKLLTRPQINGGFVVKL